MKTVWMLACAASAFAASRSNVAIDNQGNIWRTGQNLLVSLTPNAFQKTEAATTCATQQLSPFDVPTSVPCSHAFVTKQDPAGNILYATYFGGSSEDGGIAITTDAEGNAYVTGFTYSPDFPVTANVVQRQNAGPLNLITVINNLGPFGPVEIVPGGDTFIAKFAPDGMLVYSTLLGGSGSDVPAVIGVEATGSVYVAGKTSSTDFPVTPGSMSHQSQTPSFFVQLDPQAASLVYSTYSDATIQSFAIDNMGDAFLTGVSQPSGSRPGPYVSEVNPSDGHRVFTTYLPDLDSKFVGAGAAIAVNGAGQAIVGVSPAPMPSTELIPYAPLTYPLGPSFLVTLAAGGATVAAEIDLDNAQFAQLLGDDAGNTYAMGQSTGTLPPASSAPLLAAPCSSNGGEFVIQLDSTAAVAAATYLRQGSGEAVVVTAPAQLSVYRAASQTTVPLDLASTPTSNFACMVNLASGWVGPGIAPGMIFTLSGVNVAPAQSVTAAPGQLGLFPTSLGGVVVMVNGSAAPLLTVGAGVIEGVVPFGYAPPVSTIEVQYQGQNAPPLDTPSNFNPGIFTINGQAAVLNQDGTVNTPANPARLGTIISIFATGTGDLATPEPDGEITPLPPPYFLIADPPFVTIAGVSENPLGAGAAPGLVAGGAQVNVPLPMSLPAGTNPAAVPVVIISPGVFSPPAPISVTE